MFDDNNKTTSHYIYMRTICAIVFVTFTFSYLFFYQSDVLTLTQHILSGGKTHYQPLIGSLLITLLLFLVQLGVYFLTRIRLRFHALTYFPSLLLLAVLTNIEPEIIQNKTYIHWFWAAPLLLIIYVFAVFLVKQYQQIETFEPKVSFAIKLLWINLLQLFIMFLFVGLVGSNNDILHYRLKMETSILRSDYETALNVGKKSLNSDSSLTMLRAFCLSQKHKLGEDFFTYPIVGGSESLLPDNDNVKTYLFPSDSIIKLSKRKSVYYDYKLVKLLLDRNLSLFVKELGKYYKIDYRLPVHYKEALTLYAEKYPSEKAIFQDEAMKADYLDFDKMKHSHTDKMARMSELRDVYGTTYWFYYFYGV